MKTVGLEISSSSNCGPENMNELLLVSRGTRESLHCG